MKKVKKIFAFIMAVSLMLSVLPAQNTFAATSVNISGRYHQGEARKIWGMINSFRGSSSAWPIHTVVQDIHPMGTIGVILWIR